MVPNLGWCATFSGKERVGHTQALETAKVAIGAPQFGNAMMHANGGYPGVVNGAARHSALLAEVAE